MIISSLVVIGVAILVLGMIVGHILSRRFSGLDKGVEPTIYFMVTFGACLLVFIFAPAAALGLITTGDAANIEHAEDIFSTVTHIGAIVITYWFATKNGRGAGGGSGVHHKGHEEQGRKNQKQQGR